MDSFRLGVMNRFHLLSLVTRQSVAFSSATQHAWSCLNYIIYFEDYYNEIIIVCLLFISFTLYPAHSRRGRGNLMFWNFPMSPRILFSYISCLYRTLSSVTQYAMSLRAEVRVLWHWGLWRSKKIYQIIIVGISVTCNTKYYNIIK